MKKIGDVANSYADASGEFTPGDPLSGIPATRIMAGWMNTVQRELVALVELMGGTLNLADDQQIAPLIQAWTKALFAQQHTVNLLKNGLFNSWSAGTSSAPDNWSIYAGGTVAKNNDGSIGSDYATITSDGLATNDAGLYQYTGHSDLLSDWKAIAKALHLTVKIGVKVRTSNSSVKVALLDGIGGVNGDSHSGSGNWETLWVTKELTGSEVEFGLAVYLPAANNTSAITIDVAEARLYIGGLELPYQENPLDRALEAIHYRDGSAVGHEYRNLRMEVGQCGFNADGVNNILTQIIAVQQPFTKILSAGLLIMDNTLTTDLFDVGLAAAGRTTSSFNAHLHCASIPTSGTLTAMWFAIGVD